MENKCKQCGKLNEDEAQFCDNCGASFSGDSQPVENGESDSVATSTEQAAAIAGKTAEQATVVINKTKEQASIVANKTKEKTEQTTKAAKKMWGKFSFEERLVVTGSIIGFFSFFLPWITIVKSTMFMSDETIIVHGIQVAGGFLKYLYLFPISMIIVLVLFHYSRKNMGTDIVKIKAARFYIFFGSMWFTASFSIVGGIIRKIYQEQGALFSSYSVVPAFGWFLFIVSMILLTVGGFKLQSKLLKKIKNCQ